MPGGQHPGAKAISSTLTTSGPLLSRADLVSAERLGAPAYTALTTFQSTLVARRQQDPPGQQTLRRNLYVRALAPVTNTRTWNLLIDIIAQSGTHLTPTAQTLNDFAVEGERRYWLHVAIDRYTGKVLDQQLEPVYE